MQLNGQTLEAWFGADAGSTTGGLRERGPDYLKQYEGATAQLIRHVHPEVTKGAISKDGGYLTDHGPDHIRKVIQRASEIVDGTPCQLTAYEVYILLMAIHFHDVGNALGREDHEKRSKEVMDWLGAAAGRDSIEKRTILRIARAHGGTIHGEKDTIEPLERELTILNCKIRPQLIAAIVRFADELADDRERSSEFSTDVGAVPVQALLFHRYAHALHSVLIDHEGSTINLHFDIEKSTASERHSRGDTELYLLDYIFERAVKMHMERIYCMRVLRQHLIRLESIAVRIDVYSNSELEPLETVAFRLSESGYPSVTNNGIYSICPDLEHFPGWSGMKVTGSALAERLERAAR